MFEQYISTPIIPVAVVEREEEIRNIAELCLEFLPSIELTMRTEYSYKALEILAKEYPTLSRAAATVLSPNQADKILDLGTNIIISPGFQNMLLEHAHNKKYHYIPGIATPAELEQCLAYQYVFACGGSWLCPSDLLAKNDWKEIRKRFEEAHNLIKELK